MELRLECVVDAEGVAALYVLGLGALDEDPLTRLADGERLQRPRQLPVGDGGLLLDLVVRVRVAAVEQQQHAHLVPAIQYIGDDDMHVPICISWQEIQSWA